MDLELELSHKMIRNMVSDLAANEIEPLAADIDETMEFPLETVMHMGRLGLMGMMTSKQWGGSGADTVCYVTAVEEISWGRVKATFRQ